jgi:hypothetical protein
MLLVGTDNELFDLDADRRLAEGRVTALAGHGSDIVALLDRRRVVRVDGGGGGVVELGALDSANGQSLAVDAAGDPIVGFQGARLARLRSGRPELLTGFDDVPGRSSWENPAGPEPDARSLAVSSGGGLWVNVHVGGSGGRMTTAPPGGRP